ncbi:hypothetical protein [Rhodoferax sp. GW822-FHT02A01]|uniref:hypothetical protein n=1 Tax=Rhodoferax sp. GW822-FHT02A01 TaxID=3141537 RepID=UPI00315D9DCA
MSEFDENLLDTNEFGVLRIPGRLWIGIIFSFRYAAFFATCLFITPLFSYFEDISEHLPYLLILLFEAPAILLFVAAGFRTPNGMKFFQFIWKNGRLFLALASFLNITYTILFLFKSNYWQRWPELFMASCALIDLIILRTSMTSPHIIQVFSEVPKADS